MNTQLQEITLLSPANNKTNSLQEANSIITDEADKSNVGVAYPITNDE